MGTIIVLLSIFGGISLAVILAFSLNALRGDTKNQDLSIALDVVLIMIIEILIFINVA